MRRARLRSADDSVPAGTGQTPRGVRIVAIEPLVMNSPLFSWLHAVLGTQGISNAIGVAEIVMPR
jgi:hypothetical protein